MDVRTLIEVTKIAISLVFLIVSSVFDYRERRIPNLVFVLVPATAIDIYFFPDPLAKLITLLLYTGFSFAVFFTIYFLGLFGGADAKLLTVLTIMMPWPPSTQTIRTILEPNLPIFALSIFNNTLLTSALIAPYSILSNLIWKRKTGRRLFENVEDESFLRKLMALLFCIKTEKAKIQPYDMIAEESGKITMQKVREEDLTEEDLEHVPENVFVVFSIPMVLFITLGFVISLILGDLLMSVVRAFWSLLLPSIFLR
jgi:preflagellin peptidase FlaK